MDINFTDIIIGGTPLIYQGAFGMRWVLQRYLCMRRARLRTSSVLQVWA